MNEFLLGDGGSAETPAEQPDKPASERLGNWSTDLESHRHSYAGSQ